MDPVRLVSIQSLRWNMVMRQQDPKLSAEEIQEAEREILRRAQQDSFTEECNLLSSGKPVHTTSRLLSLAPEYDKTVKLIRVGGRLRWSDQLEPDTVHPVILDLRHRVTQLIIQDTDKDLHHPGAERLFAELRRKYWILHGRTIPQEW